MVEVIPDWQQHSQRRTLYISRMGETEQTGHGAVPETKEYTGPDGAIWQGIDRLQVGSH